MREISNNALAKIDWVGFATLLVIGGIAWGSVTQRLEATENSARVQGDSLEELRKNVSDIERKLDVMGNNQGHFKAQIDRIRDNQKEISSDQKEALRLLRQRYTGES